MIYVLTFLYVVVCLFLVLVVLLQQGKGADVASAFGASSSQTTFGARGTATVLEKITTWAFVAFSVLAISISLIQSRPRSLNLSKVAKPVSKPVAPAPASPLAPVPATGVPMAVPSTAAPAPASAVPVSPAPAPATSASPAGTAK